MRRFVEVCVHCLIRPHHNFVIKDFFSPGAEPRHWKAWHCRSNTVVKLFLHDQVCLEPPLLVMLKASKSIQAPLRVALGSQVSEPAVASRKVIFSGIQPTEVPHLGNYLGALQEWVRLQDCASKSTKLLFSIVDLHALTNQSNAHGLRQWRRETLAALLAVGIDPERSVLFFQSDVRALSSCRRVSRSRIDKCCSRYRRMQK